MKKAFVLLSGGIDSTTCLHQAIIDYAPNDSFYSYEKGLNKTYYISNLREHKTVDWVEAYSIYYGQRHSKEMEYAEETCDTFGIKHTILDVGNLLRGDTVMLTKDSEGKVEVPNISYNDIKGVSPTYVPFRNGLLLSAITAQAQKWVNKENEIYKNGFIVDPPVISQQDDKPSAGIYFGAHAEDAHNWAYPDCTPEFIGAMANAIYIGSYMQIRLHTPLEWLDKQGVIQLGNYLNVDWNNTWSCYKGEDKHCGVCPTCRSRREGFILAGTEDPTEYAA